MIVKDEIRQVEHDVVAAGQLKALPSLIAAIALMELAEWSA